MRRQDLLRATAVGTAVFGTLWGSTDGAFAQSAPHDWTGFHFNLSLTASVGGARTATFNTPDSNAYNVGFANGVPLVIGAPFGFIATDANDEFRFAEWDGVVALDPSEAIGGTFGFGYDWQFGRVVVGIAADASRLRGSSSFSTRETLSGTTAVAGDQFYRHSELGVSTGVNWLMTVRPRIGVAFDRVMVYGTGGLAFGQAWINTYASLDEQYVDVGKATNTYDSLVNWSGSNSEGRFGYAVGGGAEFAVNERVSLQFEGLFYNLGRISTQATGTGSYTMNDGSPTEFTVQPYDVEAVVRGTAFKFGLNYRF